MILEVFSNLLWWNIFFFLANPRVEAVCWFGRSWPPGIPEFVVSNEDAFHLLAPSVGFVFHWSPFRGFLVLWPAKQGYEIGISESGDGQQGLVGMVMMGRKELSGLSPPQWFYDSKLMTSNGAGWPCRTPRAELQTTKLQSLLPCSEEGVVASWAPSMFWGWAWKRVKPRKFNFRMWSLSSSSSKKKKKKWKCWEAGSNISLTDCVHWVPLKSNQNRGKMEHYGSSDPVPG